MDICLSPLLCGDLSHMRIGAVKFEAKNLFALDLYAFAMRLCYQLSLVWKHRSHPALLSMDCYPEHEVLVIFGTQVLEYAVLLPRLLYLDVVPELSHTLKALVWQASISCCSGGCDDDADVPMLCHSRAECC